MSIDWMRQNDPAEAALFERLRNRKPEEIAADEAASLERQRQALIAVSGIEADDTSFSGGGVMPWHGTNVTVLDGNPTAAEALEAAGLGWRVNKEPVYVVSPDIVGEEIATVIPRYFAVVRETDRKALGVVQQRYELLQNVDAFAWADALLGGDVRFETAGSLKGGRVVYLTAKTPFIVDLPGGDRLETYLLISNRHDGGGAVTVAIITIRVVCGNTLSRSIAGALGDVKIRHTVSLPTRMATAQRILGLAKGASDRAEEIASKLVRTKLSERKFQNFLDLLLAPEVKENQEPSPRELAVIARRRSTIEEVYHDNPTQAEIKGTAWGAYNGVTFYNDHLISRRTMSEGDGSPADQRMLAILSGKNIGDKALSVLLDGIGTSRWLKSK